MRSRRRPRIAPGPRSRNRPLPEQTTIHASPPLALVEEEAVALEVEAVVGLKLVGPEVAAVQCQTEPVNLGNARKRATPLPEVPLMLRRMLKLVLWKVTRIPPIPPFLLG